MAEPLVDRWLPADEWPALAPRFAEHGVGLPNPDLSRIRVVEDAGRIVAFLVVQWQPHAEPLWIDPAYRGRVYWPKLFAAIEADTPGIYAFAPDAHIAAGLDALKLTRLDWAVYRREEMH